MSPGIDINYQPETEQNNKFVSVIQYHGGMIGVLWVIWGYYLSVGEVSALFWHIAVKGL